MSTRHARVADKELNDKHTKILLELLQKPENKQCADCRKKDPRWASWNLGIFICIRCSGTHRSLGTHISKVKSVDLDTWIPEQIDSMVKWGNLKANSYWEADLNGRLPTENSMDMWIRAKYEQRIWASKTPVPDPSTIVIDANKDVHKSTAIELVSPKPEANYKNSHPYHSTYSASHGSIDKNTVKTTDCLPAKTSLSSNNNNETTPSTKKPISEPFNMASFQEQLSGLSIGHSSSGLIPKAPPGSNMSWTNFLTAHKPADMNTTLSQPSTEKPLIPYELVVPYFE